MSNNIKICPDGFVWKKLTSSETRKLFMANIFDLFKLYDDNSEGLIESEEELEECLNDGVDIGIEVGFCHEADEEYIENLQEISSQAVYSLTEALDCSRQEAFSMIRDWAREYTETHKDFDYSEIPYYDSIDLFIEDKMKELR